MNLNSFTRAQVIRNKISAIDFQLSLLSNNDHNDFIVSYYERTSANENDGNPIDLENEDRKINTYLITDELKNSIKEELFKQKSKLEEEFNLL